MSPSLPRRRLAVLACWIAWALCTTEVLAVFAHPASTPVVEDEVYWIGSAYYYDLAFHQHDFGNADWDLLPARENPPIAKYAIGASLALSGQRVRSLNLLGGFYVPFEASPRAWGEGDDYAKRAAVVARIDPEVRRQLQRGGQLHLNNSLLLPARRAMIVCAVATSLLLFLLGVDAGHALVGLLASQLWLAHPAVVRSYNHAEADAVAALFCAATVLLGFVLFRRCLAFDRAQNKTTLLLSLATGVTLALACGAKMNALVVGLLLGALMLFLFARALRARAMMEVRWLLATHTVLALGTLVVFVGSNPTILHDLGGGLTAVVREHRLTELIQAQFLPDHLSTIGAKLSAVTALASFGSVGFAIVLSAAIALAVFARTDRFAWFITGWWAIAWIAVTLWIPFPRTRYVLPTVLPSAIVVALALGLGFRRLTERLRRAPARVGPSVDEA